MRIKEKAKELYEEMGYENAVTHINKEILVITYTNGSDSICVDFWKRVLMYVDSMHSTDEFKKNSESARIAIAKSNALLAKVRALLSSRG